MGTLAICGVLFGLVLGHVFKWPVLYPAFALGAILILVYPPGGMEPGFSGWLVHIAVLTASLQIGYLTGLAARGFYPPLRRFVSFGAGSLEGKPPRRAQSSGSGRKAA